MGYASGRAPGFSEVRNYQVYVSQISLQNHRHPVLDFPRSLLLESKESENWARVHFIPNLKDGEFVTLRTPNVSNWNQQLALSYQTKAIGILQNKSQQIYYIDGMSGGLNTPFSVISPETSSRGVASNAGL